MIPQHRYFMAGGRKGAEELVAHAGLLSRERVPLLRIHAGEGIDDPYAFQGP